MKSDPLSALILDLLHKAPDHLLLIGGFPFDQAPIGDRTTTFPNLKQALQDPPLGAVDAIIWRAENTEEPVGPAFGSLLAQRGRLLIVTSPGRRRDLLLDLFAAGFYLQEERDAPNSEALALLLRRDEFPVRCMVEGDQEKILELFTPSFFAERSPHHWTWKFDENPWGRRIITVATAADGRLVGHYAGYPSPWVLVDPKGQRRDLSCLQIGDTMTDAKYRHVGRGPTSLLGRCARHFYTAYCENRVAFNYGFNTGNIQKFSILFVGAHRIEPVGFWTRSATLPEGGRSYRVREQSIDGSFTTFFDKVARHYGLLVRRDARYLQWRYVQCPDQPPFVVITARRFWGMVGWSVFQRRGDRLRWCDALFQPEHAMAAAAILRAALKHPSLQGVKTIEAWFPPRPAWWRATLSQLGFSAKPEPQDLSLMLVPHAEKDAERLLRECSYYTLGDSDLA